MRKLLMSAGLLFVAALAFATASKADTVEFTLTGSAMPGGASFSLPASLTPTAGSGPFIVANVPGTLLGGAFTYSDIELGVSATNQWSFGSNGVPSFPGTTGAFLGIFTSDLFTFSGGTLTFNINGAAFQPGGVSLMNNAGSPLTLTATDIPSVGTPEPASLLLLGFGGLSLLGLRRRKAA